jgi:hypothetical protein
MFKRNKFGNKKTIVDGIIFDSKLEAKHYLELKELLIQGLIENLELQPRYELQSSFTDSMGVKHRKIEYVADMKYFDKIVNEIIVVDCKGYETDIYKIKRKLFLFKFPELNFLEIFS